MWSSAKGEENVEARRNELLQRGFELFSTKNIESVNMRDVAKAVGCGIASVYRYYNSKEAFVVAVATWKWEQVRLEIRKYRERSNFDKMTAAEAFDFYLTSFLVLYRRDKNVLRFNQFFNVYVISEKVDAEITKPYQKVIKRLETQFHDIYLKALEDHTLRTDISEINMFSTSLHLMLAAVTRYAVGLLYLPEDGYVEETELEHLKEMLLKEYTV